MSDPTVEKEPTERKSTEQSFIDKMTIEYMMNRQYHRQYLAKTDQTKYQEVQSNMALAQQHRERILDVVKDLVDDFATNGSFTHYTSALNQSFETFLFSCLNYLEEHPPDENDQDTEVLFASPPTKKTTVPRKPRRDL